ncbi:MAG: transcription-repair coupling factor [Hyphomicrobiales bacterium]
MTASHSSHITSLLQVKQSLSEADTPLSIGLGRIVEGQEPLVLAELLDFLTKVKDGVHDVIHVCRDDQRLASLKEGLEFFAPTLKVLSFSAWDCVPYDRSGPRADIIAERIATLAQLEKGKRRGPRLILTTPRALLQRVPPRSFIRSNIKILSPGKRVDRARLLARLSAMGYMRSEMVIDKGEFAVRGGIIDLFLAGYKQPIRLDFWGDELESIRQFDAGSQRTTNKLNRVTLLPVSEVDFSDDARALFRKRYLEHFGAPQRSDALYDAVSEGQSFQGQEHWLSFFHENLDCLFDYVSDPIISEEADISGAITAHFDQIDEHFEARKQALEVQNFGAPPYNPVPVEQLFLTRKEWQGFENKYSYLQLSPFDLDRDERFDELYSLEGKAGINFVVERRDERASLFNSVVRKIKDRQSKGKRILIAAWSNGSRERLVNLLQDAGLEGHEKCENWQEAQALPEAVVGFIVLGIEAGFETDDCLIIGEQDILGDRLVRRKRRAKSDADVLKEASTLSIGDLIVHNEHGIGKFIGLKTITAVGAPHDCLELVYHGGDKLYLPVENIELLTRFGAEGSTAELDRLGGTAWQARKAKIKKKLLDMAGKLIDIAAKRALRKAESYEVPNDQWDEFTARFPFDETEDQLSSIEAVRDDLASGKPMDRLICGDVGFGKTEVAMRAAFVAAMSGAQVAIVAPTTLLARQHYQGFTSRFEGLPLKIGHASRLVSHKDLRLTKEGVKDGQIDIVIGTHALLGKSIEFHNLGLLIIDEEQHFGVQHKERLKELKDNVHVLTLSATPIPRTLQMSLTGVRDLSLITTPPVDRLAVRTYVSPFDPVVIRNALLRERFRGGQSFFVCPRVSDLDEAESLLKEHVPEIRVVRAHGQMPTGELEDVMNAFYDRKYDCLLSTTIIESGLDIPTANTMIIYRADHFGLSQLYQLRGRVGRSKTRAYAYMTTPVNKALTPAAEKRLKILASLDTLGAGFTLAAHDLDMRGAGNLVGEEQSGHIREIGYELYQSMLEEAIEDLKHGGGAEREEDWTPVIQVGTAVLIPESYVKDLQLRLSLYRKASTLPTKEDIDAFKAELHDRFGPLPDEVKHLLSIMYIKTLCRKCGVATIDAGPMGAQVSFHRNKFSNPGGLIEFAASQPSKVKLQANHKMTFKDKWEDDDERIAGVIELIEQLVKLSTEVDA